MVGYVILRTKTCINEEFAFMYRNLAKIRKQYAITCTNNGINLKSLGYTNKIMEVSRGVEKTNTLAFKVIANLQFSSKRIGETILQLSRKTKVREINTTLKAWCNVHVQATSQLSFLGICAHTCERNQN